nr:hypothetical protein [Sulfurovaceae bacterium]
VPNIPTLISPENNIILYNNHILLKWKTINNADTYKLSIHNLTDNRYVNGFTKLNSITISDLTMGKKFFVLVKACNSSGCSKNAKLDFTTKTK